MRRIPLIADARQDVEYALRTLIKAPLFTIAAVGTLALGIGAAVAVFTVVNAVLLRPLPVRDPEHLAVITAKPLKQRATVGASWTRFELLQKRHAAFDALAAYVTGEFTVVADDAPARVIGQRVTADFFAVLGVAPALGRSLRAGEDADSAAPVAIITDGFWRGALGGDPHVIGRTIKVDARETTIVGVLPARFRFQFADSEPQVYLNGVSVPSVLTTAQIRHGAGFLTYVARLKPGATVDQARRDLAVFDEGYRREFGSYVDAAQYELQVVPFLDDLVGTLRPALALLLASVLLLLLIACANVAHLLLARATGRRREIAVRLALGASTARLVRQFLAESLVLAVAGATCGVFAARSAVAILVAFGPASIPRLADAAPDGRVIAFAVALAVATAVAFGFVPLLRIRTARVADSLGDGRGGGQTAGTSRLHRWIAASESAVTLVLLVAAALLFESLMRLHAVDIGFEPAGVYTAEVALPRDQYSEPRQREAFFTSLLNDIQNHAGIDAAAATSYLPMAGSNYGFFFFLDGWPRTGAGRDPTISVRHVSADYFRVMHIPVLRGRAFTERDAPGAAPVAIINEGTVRRYFGGADPIGRRVGNSTDAIMREIIGVVGDVRFAGPARDPLDELYLPYRQAPWPSMAIVVTSGLRSDAVARVLRDAVARLDPDQALAQIRPMPAVVAAMTTQERFTSSLVGAFAGVATMLAAVGLAGVIAVFVGQKRQEFGIRMALGAQRADVLRLVMREAAVVCGFGLAAGVLGAVAMNRLLAGMLYGVNGAAQGATCLGAVIVLAVVGGLASYLPVRRATSVPPLDALRAE